MAVDREQRKHERTPLRTNIRICHPSFGELKVKTRDISHSGVFLLTSDQSMPPIGTVIEGQVQDDYGERPVVQMEIVRVEPDGIGLKFVD